MIPAYRVGFTVLSSLFERVLSLLPRGTQYQHFAAIPFHATDKASAVQV
jgi:hypothetical protein